MDFIERVQELAAKAKQVRLALQGIDTEEATKNALVMPFIKDVLDYDVFNPLEVVPEFTADVGVKKGEKVDYAIMKDGKPVIHSREIKRILNDQLSSPTDDFLRFIAARVYSGLRTQAVLNQFRPIAKSAFAHFINDKINERLKTALNQEPQVSTPAPLETVDTQLEIGVVTTDDEKQGFFIVKAILGEVTDPKRVYMRDQKGFCSILMDDNNRKPLLKLYFNSVKKRLVLFDENKGEQIEPVDDVNDIFRFANEIRSTAHRYLTQQEARNV